MTACEKPERGRNAQPEVARNVPHDPFYMSSAWRRTRAAFLVVFPRCSVPGCGRAATHVDHIKARRAGGAGLDPGNLQGFCHPHHSSKTSLVDGGFGRPGTPGAKLRAKGCNVDGTPLDPGHHWRR